MSLIERDRDLRETEFAVLDFETTGLSTAQGHRVCEVAITRGRPGEGSTDADEFQSLIDPGRDISPGAQKISGITREMVRGKPEFAELADRVLDLLDGAVFVAHSATFDLGFLWSELVSAGQPVPDFTVVDTCRLSRNCFSYESNSLDFLAGEIAGSTARHRALSDVRHTKQVLDHFLEEMGERVRTVGDLVAAQGGPVHPPKTPGPELFPDEMRNALKEGTMLNVYYRSGRGRRTNRWITPWLLGAKQGTYYLHAYCHLRDDRRCFRLDRVEEITGTEEEQPDPWPGR